MKQNWQNKKKITTFWEIKYNLTLKFNVQHDKKESQFFFFSGKDKTKILSVRETEKKIASKIKKIHDWLQHQKYHYINSET